MAWLSDYAYRKKVTIDNTKIDGTLTNFPVVVLFGSGEADYTHWEDTTNFFDTRFTNSDGSTELDFDRVVSSVALFPDTNLVGHWKLNDNAADKVVLDSTANLNSGACDVNTDTISQAGAGINTGTSLLMNAATITVPPDAAINDIFDGGGSISFWWHLASRGAGETLIRQGSSTGYNLIASSNEAPKFIAYWNGGVAANWGLASGLSVGDWHHVVITYDSSSTASVPSIYVDGVDRALAFTGTAPAGTYDSGAAIDVVFYGQGFEGDSLDEIRFYNTEISLADAITLYQEGNGTEDADVVWFRNFYYVELDSIASGTDTDFYMYYGKSGDSNGANGANTWSNDFQGVYYLDDDTTSTVVTDSSNSRNGTHGGNTDVDSEVGKIYKGINFATRNSTLPSTVIQSDGIISLSCWYKQTVGGNTSFFGANDGGVQDIQFWGQFNGDVYWRAPGGDQLGPVADGIVPTDGFHHYMVTKNNVTGNMFYYIDGAELTTVGSKTGTWEGIDGVVLGWASSTAYRAKGIIEAFTISSVERSAAWAKAEYNAGNDSLLAFGSEEENSAGDIVTGLVAHYKMNDNAPTTRVSNIFGRSGTLGGGDNTDDIYVVGKVNGALDFNGSDDYVDTNQTFEGIFQDSFSIAMWVKPTDGQPAGDEDFMGVKPDASNLMRIMLDNAAPGKLQFRYEADNIGFANATTNVAVFSDGQETWHHIVCVAVADTQLYIYFDGALQELDAVSDGDASGATFANFANAISICMGCNNNVSTPSNFFTGPIDDVRIYSRALEQGDIDTLYNSGNGTEADGIAFPTLPGFIRGRGY